MNKYRIWVVAYDQGVFRPKSWRDNPDVGIVYFDMMGLAVDLATAREGARGFNEGEIASPCGVWAIVCQADLQLKKDQRVTIKANEPSEV